MNITAGSRWRSAVDTTEVVVIRAPSEDSSLECGGQQMVVLGTDLQTAGTVHPDYRDGTTLGKRYCDDDTGLEVLCTKAGEGSLALGGRSLHIKEAKPLPSSD